MYKQKIDVCWRNLVAVGNQYILNILRVSVALVIHHVKRMRHIFELSGSTMLSSLYHKRHDLQKKIYLNIKCVF